MLRIRLSRVGKKKQPAYRLVVTDSRNPREGAHLEIVGQYNPLTNPATIVLKEERLVHWLQVGAKPSETAAKILTKAGVMEKAGREPFVYEGKQVPRKEEAAKAEESPAPAAAAPAPAATAVAEPAAAEEPAAVAEPAAAEEPEAVAEPAAAEEPEAVGEPAAAEEPAAEAAAPAEDPPPPEAAAEAPAEEAPAAEPAPSEE